MKTHEKFADKVAIVGMAQTTRNKAPFGSKEYEIWGMNDLRNYVPRVDVLFQLHDAMEIDSYQRDYKHWEYLKNDKEVKAIYMADYFPDIPKCIPYPKGEIIAHFGTYFTNGISWLLALAIAMEYKEIQLWGVEMSTASEFGKQKGSVEFFLGWAKGAGIKVFLPHECQLLKTPRLYGFDGYDFTYDFLVRTKEEYEKKKREAEIAYYKSLGYQEILSSLREFL